MMILPFFIFGKVLSKSATTLKADRKNITIKLLWRKPLILPLENIIRIDTFEDIGTSRHFYVIKTKEINFNTSLFAFSFKKNLNMFIEELKRRVAEAKK